MAEKRSIREAFIYNDLAGVLGYDNVSMDEVVRQAYSGDAWLMYQDYVRKDWPLSLPDYVVWPETVEQVAEVVRLANRHKLAVTPYCGGAGPYGGTVPIYGGITLDVKRLLKFELDERSLMLTAGTGWIGQELENKLNGLGYTYAHIPQSSHCSGLGGFVSAGSAGMLSTKYGKVSDMVRGMQVVLPTGEIVRTRVAPASAAGPNLNYWFMGAEGVLGVITEVTISIHPLPEVRRFRGLLLPSVHAGLEAGRKIMRHGLRPAAMRLSDAEESKVFYNRDGCLLLWAFDGFKELVDLEESVALRIAQDEGGVDLGPEPGNAWWDHRFAGAFPRDPKTYPTRVGGVFDTCGSYDQMERIHKEMGEAVAHFEGVWYAAHFSHWYKSGIMMYPYVFVNAQSEDEMVDLNLRLQKAAVDAILRVGGTINHHHGIGMMLGSFMRGELGAGFDVLQRVKHTLDPHNILNPGKMGLEGR